MVTVDAIASSSSQRLLSTGYIRAEEARIFVGGDEEGEALTDVWRRRRVRVQAEGSTDSLKASN